MSRYNEARQLGDAIATLASEREAERLTPYVDVSKLPEAYRQAVMTKNGSAPVTEEDIARARDASLGIAIEATAQVAEQAFGGGVVNERLESLEGLSRMLADGNSQWHALLQADRAKALGLTREAVARRLGKEPAQVAMRDEDLTKWLDEQYQHANGRLGKGIEAIEMYLATSLR